MVSAKFPVRYLCSRHVFPTFAGPRMINFASLQDKNKTFFHIYKVSKLVTARFKWTVLVLLCMCTMTAMVLSTVYFYHTNLCSCTLQHEQSSISLPNTLYNTFIGINTSLLVFSSAKYMGETLIGLQKNTTCERVHIGDSSQLVTTHHVNGYTFSKHCCLSFWTVSNCRLSN